MMRRDVLAAAALVVGPRAAGTLLDLFADPAAARALGRHALAVMPAMEAGPLAAALERELAGPGALRLRVAAAARRDFAAGRVACVDGWMLARVEARLCALVALDADARS